MKKYCLWILLVVSFVACKKDKSLKDIELNDDYRYTFGVVVKGFWSEQTHPQDFPQTARFGTIVGVSHRKDDVLFKKGNKAPSWFRNYFEEENPTDFVSYFKESKDGDRIDAIISEQGFEATESKYFEFTTTGRCDKLSFMIKVLPSPDWFIAVENLDLNTLSPLNGMLISKTFVVSSALDAGIFSGKSYLDRGQKTNDAITFKSDYPLNIPDGGVNKFAMLTIRLKNFEKIEKDK